MSVLLSALLLAAAAPQAAAQSVPAPAAAAERFDAAQARAIVLELAAALEGNFVFPEVGKAYADALRSKLAGGGYAAFVTRDDFAEAVTADLQAVHKDGHLRLFAPKVPGQKARYRTEPSADGAIGRSGWIGEGVAYIELTMFPSDPVTLGRLRAFLDAHASAKTLVIDIRGHHGGDIGEIDVLASYLLPGGTQLAEMDTRAAVDAAGRSPFVEGPTIARVDGPPGVVRRAHFVLASEGSPRLKSARLFVLTSKKTASAGEHLAMVLKRTGRATLVGEATLGAGHFGEQYKLGGGFSAFIPVGRSFDPDTGESWEGVGVKPHIAVPADQALDEALRRAGFAISAQAALASLR